MRALAPWPLALAVVRAALLSPWSACSEVAVGAAGWAAAKVAGWAAAMGDSAVGWVAVTVGLAAAGWE